MNSALNRATYAVWEGDLEWMVLAQQELPEELRGFEVFREGPLDNAEMAEHGFGGYTGESYGQMGRVTGYMREFALPHGSLYPEGGELVGATVVHLFRDEQGVSQWIDEVFVKGFLDRVGKEMGDGQELVAAERVEVDGLHDQTAALFVLQRMEERMVSSTIVDFRLGRLLGVAYVMGPGDDGRQDLVRRLALELERKLVRVVLGSA